MASPAEFEKRETSREKKSRFQSHPLFSQVIVLIFPRKSCRKQNRLLRFEEEPFNVSKEPLASFVPTEAQS